MDCPLPPRFASFLEPDLDRFAFLGGLVAEEGLRAAPVNLAGGRHLLVSPSATGGGRPRTVLIAHYDRAPGSPGANDNSAAVFMLVAAARRLEAEGKSGWLMVFTDREECAAEGGPRGQGAYALAQGLKSIGLGEADYFIFDACGRGDTVIVSTTVDDLLSGEGGSSERALSGARKLRLRALDAGRGANARKVLLAPTPFSDDAGFLAAGLCAQTVTVLPQGEASALVRAVRLRPERARALISREARDSLDPTLLGNFYPRTWSIMHGPGDHLGTLTPRSFPAMERFVVALVGGA